MRWNHDEREKRETDQKEDLRRNGKIGMRELPKVRIQPNVCSSTYILISPPDTFRDTPMHMQKRTQTYTQTLSIIQEYKYIYTNPDTQIHIYKPRYTTTYTQTHVHKNIYTNTYTQTHNKYTSTHAHTYNIPLHSQQL